MIIGTRAISLHVRKRLDVPINKFKIVIRVSYKIKFPRIIYNINIKHFNMFG